MSAAHVRGPRKRERLGTPPDLARWLVQANVLDQLPTLGEADLRAARRLREAIYRLVTEPAGAQAADIRLVNVAARHAPPIPALTGAGSRHVSTVEPGPAALSEIARDAIDLVSSPLRDRIRTCASEECGAPFLDTSRPGQRRWCYMGRCGNRAKKASYRRRQRSR